MNSSIATPKLSLLALAIAAALIAGCGGDDEPSEGPAEVTEAFLVALANQDAEAACGYVSEQGLEDVEAEGQSCEEAVLGAVGEVSEEDVQAVEDATYEVTEETEDTATVSATRADGDEQSFELVVEDGEWKVSG